jgi:hypothetical protein
MTPGEALRAGRLVRICFEVEKMCSYAVNTKAIEE